MSAATVARRAHPAGERSTDRDREVAAWAALIHEGAEGLVEVVTARRDANGALRMRSRSDPARYPRAGDVDRLVALAREHRAMGDEVFATPLSRRHPRPGKAGGVLAGKVVWVDIDERAGVDRLRAFAHRPHLVVYSGSGGVHAYWRLDRPLAPAAIEAANRALAQRLCADPASTDRARIMRLPGTDNHKAGRPCRIAYQAPDREPLAPARLLAGLTDPNPPPRRCARDRPASRRDDALERIAPPAYFRALAGVEVADRGGHVACPLPDHDDQLASCTVYADAERGWWCFGCARGGSVYDLASLLDRGPWARDLRREAFAAARSHARAALGLDR